VYRHLNHLSEAVFSALPTASTSQAERIKLHYNFRHAFFPEFIQSDNEYRLAIQEFLAGHERAKASVLISPKEENFAYPVFLASAFTSNASYAADEACRAVEHLVAYRDLFFKKMFDRADKKGQNTRVVRDEFTRINLIPDDTMVVVNSFAATLAVHSADLRQISSRLSMSPETGTIALHPLLEYIAHDTNGESRLNILSKKMK